MSAITLEQMIRPQMFSMGEIIRDRALQAYTPELIEKTLMDLKSSDKDRNKKLSKKEAAEYLKGFLESRAADGTQTASILLRNIGHEINCENAGSSGITKRMGEDNIAMVRADVIGELKFLQQVASLVETSSKKDKKVLAEQENKLVDSYSQIVSRNLAQLPMEGEVDTKAITREIIEKTKTILSEKPGLLKQIHDMPDFSSLGQLNANHVCKAITGKGVGLQA
jgi:hypothetical protein